MELPPELICGITRNETRKFCEIWEAITDCLQHPLALTRTKNKRTKAVAFTLNPLKYDEVIDYCSRMLSKNLCPLMRRNYGIPALPMFGRKDVSEGDVEVYEFHDFEILETCFRRDVELFILYLTRFQQLLEEEEAAKPKIRESPPHFNSLRGGPRTSMPWKASGLPFGPAANSDQEPDERTVQSPQPLTRPHHKKHHRSRGRDEIPRREWRRNLWFWGKCSYAKFELPHASRRGPF